MMRTFVCLMFTFALAACERPAGNAAPAQPEAAKSQATVGGADRGAADPKTGRLERVPPPQQTPKVAKVALNPDDPSLGPAGAPVTVIEFSDFECPYCKRGADVVHRLHEEYPTEVRVVFKQNPLPMHKNAMLAAEASLEAHAQGRFWEYHDRMFNAQKDLGRAALEAHAQAIGLDLGRFRAALDSGEHRARVTADMAEMARAGGRGTPFFVVNGTVVKGARPYEHFKALVEKEMGRGPGPAPDAPPRPQLDPSRVYPVDVAGSQARGPEGAPLTIVVFTEFQCGFCAKVQPTVQALIERYGDRVRIVHKSMPLPMHKDAFAAAEAAEAAGEQGRFWEFHDALWRTRQVDAASLERTAAEVGIDVARWKAEIASGRPKTRVQADMALAQKLGVTGTPTFFLNGRPLVGAVPLERFVALADEVIGK
jgi:protein-disulfide isomerase